MSVEKTEVEMFFGRCRCCLSYGYLKNMWKEHDFKGEPEIYGEMLVQCFALTWDQSEEAMEQDQICEQCIGRLRDANKFKKVVLDSQEELLREIDSENVEKIKEENLDAEYLLEYQDEGDPDTVYDTEYVDTADITSVKEEVEYEDVEFLEDEDGPADFLESDSSQEPQQRRPVVRRKKPRHPDTDDEEGTKRKWPKKLPKAERHKTYKQYSEGDLRKCLEEVRNNVLTASEAALKYKIPKKTICAKIKLDPKGDQWISNTATGNQGKGMSKMQNNRILLSKFKENVRSVLRCSNATPIRGYWGIGYGCTYCKYQTPEISELKTHTLKEHSENIDELDHVKYASDMIIKLDITGLKCVLCDQNIETLEEIMNHIKFDHEQPMHLDIKNQIVPFKFGKEYLYCTFCDLQFNYFKHLSEHMNEHYPNYPCPKCDRFFINQRALRIHSIRHQIGTFVCSFCPKIFDTRIKMKEHERVLHLKGSKTRKCGYCDERFMDAVRKADHEVKEHGAPIPQFACKACGKCFESQRSVNNHMNQFHLLHRPNTCPECGKGFYNKNELKRHRVKHTKIKEYQCTVCSKFYVTKSSLKSHMKKHDTERTFTCDKCGDMFIQKNVWVNHMANHAENASDS